MVLELVVLGRSEIGSPSKDIDKRWYELAVEKDLIFESHGPPLVAGILIETLEFREFFCRRVVGRVQVLRHGGAVEITNRLVRRGQVASITRHRHGIHATNNTRRALATLSYFS